MLKRFGKTLKNAFTLDNKNKVLRLNIILIGIALFGIVASISGFNKSHAVSPSKTGWEVCYQNNTGYSLPGESGDRSRYYLHPSGTSCGNGGLYAFCLWHGKPFCSSYNGYELTTVNTDTVDHWNNFSDNQKMAIAAVAAYGYSNTTGDGVPEALSGQGITADDSWWATQMLIWEFQTKCRVFDGNTVGSVKSGSNCTQYHSSLNNKKAEIVYNYILEQIKLYLRKPSFARTSKSEANSMTAFEIYHIYDMDSKNENNYKRTYEDRNSATPVKTSSKPDGFTLTHDNDSDGNEKYIYTFTSTVALNPTNQNVSLVKDVSDADFNGEKTTFVWGKDTDCQTMFTGDKGIKVEFYTKVRTTKPGYLEAIKTSDDWEKHRDNVEDIYKDVKFEIIMTSENNSTVNKTIYGADGFYGIDSYITVDNSGNLNYKGNNSIKLYPGSYKLVEISPDSGTNAGRYRALTKTFTINEDATTSLKTSNKGENGNTSGDIHNDLKEGFIELQKYYDHDEGATLGHSSILKPEAGAIFRIYPVDYAEKGFKWDSIPEYWKDEVTTGADGYVKSKSLPWGEYYVEQTKGDEQTFRLEKFRAFIDTDEKTYRYVINNEEVHAKIKLIKVDKETGKVVPAANITFKLRKGTCDNPGDYVSMSNKQPTPKKISEFKTDSTGSVELPGHLTYGAYCVVETQAPSGYYLDPNYKFVINVNQQTIEAANNGKPNTFELPLQAKYGNVAQKANINIVKQAEEVKKGSNGKPQIIKKALPYAKFEVVAAETIKTGDGTVRANQGDVVKSGYTDEEGKISFEKLYLGKYYIYERSVNELKVNYTFSQDEKDLIMQEFSAQFSTETLNEGGVSAEPVEGTENSSEDADRVEEGEKLLELLDHGVYTLSSKPNALYDAESNKIVTNDRFRDAINLEIKNRTITVDMKTYQEITSDYMFNKNKPIETITLKYAGQNIGVFNVNKTYLNAIEKGKFNLSKTDVSNGKVVPGAGMRIYDEGGNVLCEGKTDKNGKLICDNLPVGKYYFQEYGAPLGYKLDETKYPFEIKTNGQVVKAKMTNVPDVINVPITDSFKTVVIYIIAGLLIIVGSLVSMWTLKKEEILAFVNKFKKGKKKKNRKQK